MRRLLLSLAATLLLTACAATRQGGGEPACDCRRAVSVPDKAFRDLLLEKGYAAKAGGHRLRPTPEGCALTALECYGKDIHSLRGIEMFPQLEEVVCSDNPLTELDLNGLPNLRRLYGLNLPLERVALDSCHHLRDLQLSYTHLAEFDLRPFSELESLLIIFSPLTELDLSPCPQLETLYIRGTQIRRLDLRDNPVFSRLHALDTPLETIVVTQAQYDGDLKVSCADTVRIEVR